MNLTEAIEILEKFNKWRRGDEELTINNIATPKLIGEAIDVAIHLLKQLNSHDKN